MKALISTATQKTEKVFLVGVRWKDRSASEVEDSLDELAELAATAGGATLGRGVQKVDAPHPATFVGSGKADEFARHCRSQGIDTVIFDDELSPAQNRNLERIFRCKVLDRTALILDIFAQRARTREGKLQVELAQLTHLLPRLTRYWSHLSRQAGGIGMRGGEGESQLESDRRRLQERIEKIEEELEQVRRQRATQRHGRQRNLWPLASIVGYTNAGKSTLLNALTGAAAAAEDKLFATLDPTTRRLRLPSNQNVLLTDTVGFIRKLPHRLVEALKATLEEVTQADLLVHVVDVSHPRWAEQIAAVESVLDEIGAARKPVLMAFNKMDRLSAEARKKARLDSFPHAVLISAKTREGIGDLLSELGKILRPERELLELRIPHGNSDVIAKVHSVGQVVRRHYEDGVAYLLARVPPIYHHELAPFIAAKEARS